MILFIHVPNQEAEAAIAAAVAAVAGIETGLTADLQDFGSSLFRTPDAVGVLWAQGPYSAAETVRRLRLGSIHAPLFVLVDDIAAGRRPEATRAIVLDAGADDVQDLPCDAAEIAARAIALGRRRRGDDIALAPDCRYLPKIRALRSGASQLFLSGKEARFLDALTSRPGSAVKDDALIAAIYGPRAADADPNAAAVYAGKLRRKLAAITPDAVIERVPGFGYRLASSPAGEVAA